MTKRIWITRTEPGASRLASALEKVGYHPLVAPVLEISPVRSSIPTTRTDLWVFVSINAVKHVPKSLWDKTKPMVAVGPSTAEELKRYGIDPLVPSHPSSEGMYALIRAGFTNQTRIMIVAGIDGRKDLANWLVTDGYPCTEWIVYDRKPTGCVISTTSLDAIVISSRMALSVVNRQYKSADRRLSTPIVVPAVDYLNLAHGMKIENVHVADGTSDTATINALNALFDN